MRSIIYCTYFFLNLALPVRESSSFASVGTDVKLSLALENAFTLSQGSEEMQQVPFELCTNCLPQIACLLGSALQRGPITNRISHSSEQTTVFAFNLVWSCQLPLKWKLIFHLFFFFFAFCTSPFISSSQIQINVMEKLSPEKKKKKNHTQTQWQWEKVKRVF